MDDFRAWLEAQGYQKGTVESSIRGVRRAEEVFHETGEVRPTYFQYLKRWLTFRGPHARDKFSRAVRDAVDPVSPDPKGGYRKSPLDEAAWRLLTAQLWDSKEDIDTALVAIFGQMKPATTLREVLRWPLDLVEQNSEKAIAKRIRKVRMRPADPTTGLKPINLNELVCGGPCTPDAAYRRILRRVHYWSDVLEAPFDFQSIEDTPWAVRAKAVWL